MPHLTLILSSVITAPPHSFFNSVYHHCKYILDILIKRQYIQKQAQYTTKNKSNILKPLHVEHGMCIRQIKNIIIKFRFFAHLLIGLFFWY